MKKYNHRKIALLITASLFLIFLDSCRTNKFVSQTLATKTIDTIHITNRVEVFRAVHDTLTIDNPCDSLSLKDFYYKSNLPQGIVIIKSYKGKIQATIDVDSIRQIYSSLYQGKSKIQNLYINKEVIKFRVPEWAIITILIESLIIGLYIYFRIIFPK